MDGKRTFITFPLDPDLKERFLIASERERRKPAAQLRILVEDFVVAKGIKPKRRRQLATSAK